jgi:glutaredoxin
MTAWSHTSRRKILLLTAEDCHFCEQGKGTLDKLTREFPLDVEEVALESDRGRDLASKFGVPFPPGLFLDGTFIGFGRISERKVRKLLQRTSVPSAAGSAS